MARWYMQLVTAALSAVVLFFSCNTADDDTGIFTFQGDGSFSSEIDHINVVPNKWQYEVGTAFDKTDMVVFAVYANKRDTVEIPRSQLHVTLGYPDKPDEDELTPFGDILLARIEDRLVIVRYKGLTAQYTITTIRRSGGGDEIIIEWP